MGWGWKVCIELKNYRSTLLLFTSCLQVVYKLFSFSGAGGLTEVVVAARRVTLTG